MSILIKGMEMPKKDSMVFVIRPNGMVVDVMGRFIGKAIHVPPHGRLIDADALINALQELFDKRAREAKFTGVKGACVTWNDAIYHIKSAPTIIPAEEGK